MTTLSLFAPGAIAQDDAVVDRDTWATPPRLAAALVDEFKCSLDVAASSLNAKCERFYTAADDGLSQPWTRREIIWCNPPYSDPEPWVRRAIEYASEGGFRAVLLLPASVGVAWFTLMCMHAEWWTFDRRIEFTPPANVKPSSSNLGNVLCVFGYGYTPRWRGIRSGITGAPVLGVAKNLQRQRAR